MEMVWRIPSVNLRPRSVVMNLANHMNDTVADRSLFDLRKSFLELGNESETCL